MKRRTQLLNKLKSNLHEAEKQYENSSWQPSESLLKLQPHKQSFFTSRHYNKPSKKLYGPFKILKRNGEVHYYLDLPPSRKIHPVLYASLLKSFKGGNNLDHKAQSPPLNTGHYPILTSLAIVPIGKVYYSEKPILQVLVKWLELPLEETSWENV